MAGRPIQGCHPFHSVVSLLQGLPKTHSGAHPWHQHSHDTAGSSVAMEDADSTEVVWLELDDKALLDSYTVLQKGILCDVFSQKCSAAWQGARGERLTVAIMLPRREDADDWLNFMLSQKNLWSIFTTRVLSQRRSLNRSLVESGAGCRPSKAPSGKSKEELDALLFDRAAKRNHTNPYEEKPYRGAAIKEVQAWWKQCKEWMAHFKDKMRRWSSTSRAFSRHYLVRKQKLSREVDAFMEHCGKRWQTREGTYQLKRRRLKPDVRDPPEDMSADVDMADI